MKRIVQIELTNHCNRRCSYCGVPTMQREKGFMSFDTLKRVVEVLHQIGQTEWLGLHHFGESTLHPQLVDFIGYLNENNVLPFLNTNGDILTDDLIERLSTVKLQLLTISGHIEMAKREILWQKCTAKGIVTQYHYDMVDNPYITNLGGQIDLPEGNKVGNTVITAPPLTDPMVQCGFLRKELGIVLWNGDLTACCFDYEGHGKFGSVFDENAAELVPHVFSTCATCPGHPGEP